MKWKAHPKFMAGQYRAVVDELLDGAAKARKENIVSLIGSLSFLGRMEEASDLYELAAKKSKDPLDRIASRFFLAIGWTRRSEYDQAKKLFDQNEKDAGKSALEMFFVHQGKAFFLFYTGRLAQCLAEAELSRKFALEASNRWALCIATDGLGHVQVKAGEIHRGLSHLKEAQELARKIGNQSLIAATLISQRLYRWEYGLQQESLAELEAALDAGFENSYSHSNLSLELARQFTLRGEFEKAGKFLESAAANIYSSQNRRQEILLNLRLAELAGRKGEFFQARHFLWFSRRLLHREVDASYELAAIGIERKLALAEGKIPEGFEAWKKLQDFSSTRDRNLRVRLNVSSREIENPEDRVHLVLQESRLAGSLEKSLLPLLGAGFLAEAALLLKLPAGKPAVAVLPKGMGILCQTNRIELRPALSSLQFKLLKILSSGSEVDKEALVTGVWGYRYAPLRHDNMVYAALSSLRKALGDAGAYLQPTENGYRLSTLVAFGQERVENLPQAAPVDMTLASTLNHRQIEILEWIRTVRFVSVNDCYKKFGVSEITALRDMDGLRRQGLVIRMGKARATRYSLAKGDLG